MRVLKLLLLSSVLTILTAAGALAAVDATYERGLIERVQASFAPAEVAPDLCAPGYPPLRCGTPLMMEIKAAWPELTTATQEVISASIQSTRPELQEYYDTPDGLFRIHFDRTGPDSVDMGYGVGEGGVPSYVLECGHLLEVVVAREIDALGFRFPASDVDSDPSGDDRYDIYFLDLGLNYYGLSVPDVQFTEPGETSVWQTSWIILHSDFEVFPPYHSNPFAAMAVTLAHEFHHASHWCYDAEEAETRDGKDYPWFLELSATAMEDIVFDDVNDYYAYLPSFTSYPWVSLRYFTNSILDFRVNHPYGACIWMLYLVQKYGPETVREIWDVCAETPGFNTFDAFETVLEANGSSFAAAWAEFLVWNYFSGRETTWSYEEGWRYPSLLNEQTPVYDTFPIYDSTRALGFPRRIDELGAQYLKFIPNLDDTVTSVLRLQLQAMNGFEEWMVVTAGLTGDLPPTIRYVRNDIDTVKVEDWENSDELLVIITPFKENPRQDALHIDLSYKYAVSDTILILPPDSLGAIVRKAYPNPFVLSATSEDTLKVVVSRTAAVEASLHIYTIDGRLIVGGSSISDNVDGNVLYAAADALSTTLRWTGRGKRNLPVASGIYLGLVQVGNKKEVVKIAVRNRDE